MALQQLPELGVFGQKIYNLATLDSRPWMKILINLDTRSLKCSTIHKKIFFCNSKHTYITWPKIIKSDYYLFSWSARVHWTRLVSNFPIANYVMHFATKGSL
jgi:hypothetical protein